MDFVAAFDSDPGKKNKIINNTEVFPLKDMKEVIKNRDVELAIITVPTDAAQSVADQIVESGITSIWNFTSHKLKVPESVLVLKESLCSGFAVLSVYKNMVEE